VTAVEVVCSIFTFTFRKSADEVKNAWSAVFHFQTTVVVRGQPRDWPNVVSGRLIPA
jgi:hypothetical protein